MTRQRRLLLLLFAGLTVFSGLAFALVSPARAHGRVTAGPYAIVVGWVEEPPIVGERNALFLAITEGEIPVTGAEATLDVELLYGGRSFRGNLSPTTTPGQYTAEIVPTVRGQYTLRIFGSLGDTDVDVIAEPEEVLDAAALQFPEVVPETRALQAELAEMDARLQAELRTARLTALAGVVSGLAGVAVGVLARWRRRDR